MSEPRTYTAEQSLLLAELKAVHGIEPSQVSFDGDDVIPIFDYTAVSHLSLKLTDIKDITSWIASRDNATGRVVAGCRGELPDGRSRTVECSAEIGEKFADGSEIDSIQTAESVAQSRAARLIIRSFGINLFIAHKNFVKSGGRITEGHTNHDPRHPLYKELHALAEDLGLIDGDDRSEYRNFIASTYDGRTSASELNDFELNRLLVLFRSLARVKNARNRDRKLAA